MKATRAGLKGTFRAFLASELGNLESIVRFGDRDLPVVNMKGEVLYNTWRDIFIDQRCLHTDHIYN